MILLSDTRQKPGKHDIKEMYFRSHGIEIVRTKLYCGDYTLPADQSVCIDTKKDIQELIGDIQVKAMPKKEIKHKIFEIAESSGIGFDLAENIYHAICDDDTDRFAEKEINDLCFQNNVSESAIKEFQKLYVKRHGFFHRGLKRAQNSEIRLIVLVENEDGISSINQLQDWFNPRKIRYDKVLHMHSIGKWKNVKLPKAEPMSGDRLAKSCMTMQQKYGVEFQFCSKNESGKRILELLGVEV